MLGFFSYGLPMFSTMAKFGNEKQDPAKEAESSIYGWDNEKDHQKVLVYVPAKLRRHESFPLEKGCDVYMRIEDGELVIAKKEEE